jgi:hypothetical protein
MIAFIAGSPGSMELILILVMASVIVVPFWRIFSKAGFSGALSLLMFIPFVNLIMIFVLAFAPWPALKQNQNN